uniref:Uncharacterized protein n=1 Tax=Micrurus carvalhoi TaxID=3147026 RepID=A0A2H6NHV1_9SAUR
MMDHADDFNAGVEMKVGNCMLPMENGRAEESGSVPFPEKAQFSFPLSRHDCIHTIPFNPDFNHILDSLDTGNPKFTERMLGLHITPKQTKVATNRFTSWMTDICKGPSEAPWVEKTLLSLSQSLSLSLSLTHTHTNTDRNRISHGL